MAFLLVRGILCGILGLNPTLAVFKFYSYFELGLIPATPGHNNIS